MPPYLKGRSKTISIQEDIILWIENPKESTPKIKKLLKLLNKLGKIVGYKTNIQKQLSAPL